MTAMLSAIFAASVAGSVHCIAMCGPLVGLHGGLRTLRLSALHALGRLATYATLGALAGGVGRALDVAGELAVVQRVATIVAGLAIVAWGGYQLAIALGIWSSAATPSRGTAFATGLVRIRTRDAARRAWLVGVLTGLLPCGWLWAFVIAAAGTGGPLAGIAVMAVFWLGTVPAMLGVIAVGGPVFDWLRARMPAVTAVVLIALGLGTLAMRWTSIDAQGTHCPRCHEDN
jgi:sulfite exporter TauE/SafE